MMKSVSKLISLPFTPRSGRSQIIEQKEKFSSIPSLHDAAMMAVSLVYFLLQFKKVELYWGTVFFTTRKGVLVKRLFIDDFLERIWNRM